MSWKSAILPIIAAALVCACGDDVTKNNVTNVYEGKTQTATTIDDAPVCNASTLGGMVFVLTEGTIYACDGTQWQPMKGSQGEASSRRGDCSMRMVGSDVEISCGETIVDTLKINNDAASGCSGRKISHGIEITCGGAIIDTLRNGEPGTIGEPSSSSENLSGSSQDTVDSGKCSAMGRFVDARDNKTYRCVTIGAQIWMAENLDFGEMVTSRGDDRRLINYQSDATTEAAQKYCFKDSSFYCDVYGALYQWHTAMSFPQAYDTLNASSLIHPVHRGICPQGWHIPTWTEWAQLGLYVDKDNARGANDEGRSLKSWSEWSNGADDYGFNALPAGWIRIMQVDTGAYAGRFVDYMNVGSVGYWWSTALSGPSNSSIGYVGLANNADSLLRKGTAKEGTVDRRKQAISVRCIQD